MDISQTNQTIATLRQQIDSVDDKLIALLKERIEYVKSVGDIKRAAFPGECPIRAGREAEMLRRIVREFTGTAVAPAAMAAMWRILIGSSTCSEVPLSLSVVAAGGNDTLYWMAREYFGPTLPIARQPNANRVIGDVKDGTVSVGIVPMLRSDDTAPWWSAIMSSDPGVPKIFAHVPFVYENGSERNLPAALAIGRVKAEDTGNDVSFIVIDADHNVSQHRLQTAFAQAGLSARWLNISSPDTTMRRHLLEISSFITPESPAMQGFLASLGNVIFKTSYLGSYAVPIHIKANHAAATAKSAAS